MKYYFNVMWDGYKGEIESSGSESSWEETYDEMVTSIKKLLKKHAAKKPYIWDAHSENGDYTQRVQNEIKT